MYINSFAANFAKICQVAFVARTCSSLYSSSISINDLENLERGELWKAQQLSNSTGERDYSNNMQQHRNTWLMQKCLNLFTVQCRTAMNCLHLAAHLAASHRAASAKSNKFQLLAPKLSAMENGRAWKGNEWGAQELSQLNCRCVGGGCPAFFSEKTPSKTQEAQNDLLADLAASEIFRVAIAIALIYIASRAVVIVTRLR